MPTEPKISTPFDTSLAVQAAITLVFCLTLCYLWLSGQQAPDQLVNITLLLVGYFFGGRLPASAIRQQAASIQAFSSALQ